MKLQSFFLIRKMVKFIDYVFNSISDFIFPQFCLACDAVLDSNVEIALCSECAGKILNQEQPEFLCFRCGRIIKIKEINEVDRALKIICADCRYIRKYFNCGRHIYLYSDYIKKIITDYKYCECRDYGILIASKMIEYLNNENNYYSKINFDCIINTPMHLHRIEKKAFDHIDLICQLISESKNIPYFKNAVVKIIETGQQAGLARKERLKNVKRSFEINNKTAAHFENKNILLIDDVYSTGATVNECSKTIKRRFKKVRIYVLTFARGI